MTTTTRIFGDALRNFEQEKPFKISVLNLNTGSHQNVGQLEKEELVSPLDFIENLRRDNHLSEDEAYLAVAELPHVPCETTLLVCPAPPPNVTT